MINNFVWLIGTQIIIQMSHFRRHQVVKSPLSNAPGSEKTCVLLS